MGGRRGHRGRGRQRLWGGVGTGREGRGDGCPRLGHWRPPGLERRSQPSPSRSAQSRAWEIGLARWRRVWGAEAQISRLSGFL